MRISIAGTELFYVRYGRGVPLIVCHGGPGLDHSYFRPYLDALGDCVELIYVDLLGCGRSGGRDLMGQVTYARWAQDLEALRVALKLGPVAMMGHGFGGFVAQAYAHAFPQTLVGLILCSTTPALDYPHVIIQGASQHASPEQMAALVASISRPATSDQALRAVWQKMLPLYFHRYQPAFGQAIDGSMVYSALAHNRCMFELAPSFSSAPWLRTLSRTTLLMGGRHDWMTPVHEGLERLQQHLSSAQVHIFENSGHYPFIEEPTGFCHVTRGFLRGLACATQPST